MYEHVHEGMCMPAVCVVIQIYHWFKFYFPLFLVMVMHGDEFETRENKI